MHQPARITDTDAFEAELAQVREAVRALVAKVGINRTAMALGSSRESVARVVGGFAVRRGTVALMRARIQHASV